MMPARCRASGTCAVPICSAGFSLAVVVDARRNLMHTPPIRWVARPNKTKTSVAQGPPPYHQQFTALHHTARHLIYAKLVLPEY